MKAKESKSLILKVNGLDAPDDFKFNLEAWLVDLLIGCWMANGRKGMMIGDKNGR